MLAIHNTFKVFEVNMKLVFSMGLVCFSLFGQPLYADYLNPTTAADCRHINIPIYQTKLSLQKQASACVKRYPKKSSFRLTDSSPTSCSLNEIKECAPLRQKICDLKDRIKLVVAACSAKLSNHRLREKEVKQAQEAFERDQRIRAEAEREQARAAHRQQMSQGNRILQSATQAARTGDGLGQAGRSATELQRSSKQAKDLINGDIKKVLLSRTGLTKYHMAYQAAHGKLPTLNAHSLSGQLTKYGTRFVLGANAAAQQDLRDALSQFDNSFGGQNPQIQDAFYNATNPRPFATQVDEAYALNDELQGHIDRVAEAVQRLPVGDQSMVNTPAGELLSEIVKARASGEISSLSNALTDYVSFVKKEALEEYQVARASQSVEVDLRKERLAVLAMVEAETKRVDALVAKTNPKKSVRNGPKRVKIGNAKHCFIYVYTDGGGYVQNSCSRTVVCKKNGSATFLPRAVSPVGWDNRNLFTNTCSFK